MAKKTGLSERGAQAFAKVRATLEAMPGDQTVQPNVDLENAAMAALILVDRARQTNFQSRAALLPKELFDKNTVEDLEDIANATLHVELESVREDAASTGVKVDLALVQEGAETRERMLKTADYNLGDQESIARELADIRSGTGYLDLANDLTRLAQLYTAHRGALADDKKNYDPEDAQRASQLATRIRDAYRAASGRANTFADLRSRAFTELGRLYNEVRATAQFVLRAHPDAASQFPPLRSGVKAVSPFRRSKKSTDGDGATTAPADPAPPNASGGGGAVTATGTTGADASGESEAALRAKAD